MSLSRLLPKRIGPLLGIVLGTFVVLAIPESASAHCCGNYVIGSDGCNIFGCNCSGPCTNFGYTCANGPISSGGACGSCPGYDTCTPPAGGCYFCTDPYYCCQNDAVCCAPSQAAQPPNQSTQSTEVMPAQKTAPPGDRFKAIDTDKSGGISFAEATKWVRANKPELSAGDLKKGFDALDNNKNGTIEPGEFDRDLAKG